MTMRGLGRIVLATAALATAAPAEVMPEGCEAFVTVQQKNCQVLVVGRCEMDGRLRAQIYGDAGLRHVEETDADWNLRFALAPKGYPGLVVVGAPRDPISKAVLLETGRDEFAYEVDLRDPIGGSMRAELTGSLEALNRTELVAGREMEALRFVYSIDAPPPGGPIEADIAAYYSAELGLYFNGAGITRAGRARSTADETPVDIFEPGEAGFLDLKPRYNCAADFASYLPGHIAPAGPRGEIAR